MKENTSRHALSMKIEMNRSGIFATCARDVSRWDDFVSRHRRATL
jgi:hypothetical protein